MAINANRSDIILKYYVAEIVSRPYKESIQFAYVRLWQNVYGKRTPIHNYCVIFSLKYSWQNAAI